MAYWSFDVLWMDGPKLHNSMNNRHKRFRLERTVIIEKFSRKDYILNANAYLWRLGIAIYMERERDFTVIGHGSSKYSTSYLCPNIRSNLNELINIYGLEYIYNLFKTFATNRKLKKLRHNPILSNQDPPQIEGVIKSSDGHHINYYRGLIAKNSANKYLLLRFNSLRALNQAGFEEKHPNSSRSLYGGR